jgi:diguanylate cyclase (GGDEF)-like protein
MDKRSISKDGKVLYDSFSDNCICRGNINIDQFVAFVQSHADRNNVEMEAQELNVCLERIIEKRTEKLERINRQLQIECETDYLTKLANRRVYERRLKENIASARRDKTYFSLLLIDIDGFKSYNDKYGHDYGDQALFKVAQTIEASLPRDTDLASRLGGEEFAVLLPSTDSIGAFTIAERIRVNVESMCIEHCLSGTGVLTVSIGIESMRPDELNKTDLFKHSDTALYASKVEKNCCHLYSEKGYK